MSNQLTLAPAIIDVSVESGDSQDVEIFLTNTTDRDIIMGVGFGYLREQSGNPGVYSIFQADPRDYLPINWLQSPGAVLVPKQSTATTSIKIIVPPDVESGLYLPTVIFSEQISGREDVAILAELVAQVRLQVKGVEDIDKSMQITNFEDVGGILFTPSREFNFSVINDSQFQVTPRGSITIYNPAGKRIATGISFNDAYRSFLPNQEQSGQGTWTYASESIFEVGHFTAQLEIVDGTNGDVLATQTIQFFVFPILTAVVSLLAILGLVIFGYLYSRRRRHLVEQVSLDRRSKRLIR